MQKYIAHRNEHTGLIQTVKEHSENTAALCREYAVSELKEFMYVAGLLHDVGKYQESFTKRINGANIRVEHSTCGALAAREQYEVFPMALMMAYCIAGHHSGIPDDLIGLPADMELKLDHFYRILASDGLGKADLNLFSAFIDHECHKF